MCMGGGVTPPAQAQVLPTPVAPVDHPVTAPAAKPTGAAPQVSANPNQAVPPPTNALNIPTAS